MKSHPVPCRSRCSRGIIHGLLTLSLAAVIAFAGSAGAQSLSLSEATIADLNAAFDAGSLTSERLVTLYLARIEAYDDDGPRLNAFLTLNPRALETARALDRERRETGPRSLLHGIPVVLKDNVDTHDMPTTAGSLLLKESIPPDDAFIVRKLREAGAIILGKANMSEFASGVTLSSIDGPMRNPHDLTRTPSGSSGGTGVASEGRYEADYTRVLDDGALQGARIGVARDFLGYDGEVDWIIGAALDAMRAAGATVVDVRYPGWLLDAKAEFYTTIRRREFKVQIEDYLADLAPGYPRTLEEMAERTSGILAPPPDGGGPNPTRWSLFQQELNSGSLDDYEYTAMRDHGLPLVRAILTGVLDAHDLDAIVYPTSPTRPGPAGVNRGSSSPNPAPSATNLANLSGLPDLIVPAGYTSDRLPVGISFLGRMFSEARLLALGYAFEQKTRVRRDPAHTPALPGETIPR